MELSSRRVAELLSLFVASIMLTGCFTSTADFKSDAEAFIADKVAAELDVVFTSVNCNSPLDQDVGAGFACTALTLDGGVYEFNNVIDKPGEFTVNISRRP
ncbi:MAG: hypothetical protein O3B90_13345 [Actinomycetota bacterium]|jgi:hypothetical protein|uniref:hypothetical protein n=1 Tax=uncultured Ilumatobacter sp. TaxID=879968 RepID=UPI00374F7EE3|nr:hypothetical protein [Actinomycetota bacterium]